MRVGLGLGLFLVGGILAWFVGWLPGAGRSTRRAWHRRRLRDGGAVLVLTGVTLLFFWPVLLAGYAFPKGGGDLWGQLYPVWSFVASQVRQGIFPLWDPLLMAGDPILSEAQYGLFNPLNWVLFFLSPPPTEVILGRGMVNVLLAGVGMYLFLTRSPRLQLGRLAGLLGGVAYMLADPFVVHLGHPQINDAMAWLPWSLFALDWALTALRTRRVGLAGIPVALMVLAGHGQMALYGLITVGLYGLWGVLSSPFRAPAARRDRRAVFERAGRLVWVAAVALALAAPALLPAMERLPWTNRSLVPDDQRRGYEFFSALLADTLAPHIHGRGADGWWSDMDRVETGYAGAVTLLLAGLGIVAQRRRALFWVGLGGLAFVFALGYQGPLYPVVARWPFFTHLWKTARAIYLLALALAVLGALGLQTLLERRGNGYVRAWCVFLVLGAIGVGMGAPHLLGHVPDGTPYQRALDNLRLVAVLALGVAALAWSWRRWRPSWAPSGILLLLVAELVALGALAETDPSPPLAVSASASDHAAALAFLQADPGWFRVDAQGSARHLWSPEALQVQGFETLQGSGNPLSLWPFEQFYWTQPNKTAPGYRLLGAKYIVMPKGDLPAGEGIWPVFTADPLIDVHLNTRALPRAWLVYRAQPVVSYEEAWQRIQSPDFRPEEVAVVENGSLLDGQGSGWIEVLRYGPNEVRLVAHTDAPALLVLSDVYYPGWQGYVDGAGAPIYRTDATFRGVMVPAGSHEVRMRFWPRSLRIALGLAALGLVVLCVAALPDRAIGWLFRKIAPSGHRS